MTRTMYDSVTPTAIPTTAAIVAGYVDGRYAWAPEDWARWGPGTIKVRIAVFPSTNDGHVLDVEPGDATPTQAPGWVVMRRNAGIDPTVYTSQSEWPAVRAAFAAAGVPEPHYWIAAYPGDGVTVMDGAVAHQYADPPTSGGNWDLSVVADYWPGVDPKPHPREDDFMYVKCQFPDGVRVATTSPSFVRLVTAGELKSAEGNINAGAFCQWVEIVTWNAFVSIRDASAVNPAALAKAFVDAIGGPLTLSGTLAVHSGTPTT